MSVKQHAAPATTATKTAVGIRGGPIIQTRTSAVRLTVMHSSLAGRSLFLYESVLESSQRKNRILMQIFTARGKNSKGGCWGSEGKTGQRTQGSCSLAR